MHATRIILVVATVVSAVVFLGMTVDTLRQMGPRTHAGELSEKVIQGKWLWQKNDCNDCHTILGIGGYYAPDVTKSYSIRGEAWLKQFLIDPSKMYPNARRMPNFHFNDAEVESIIAYLKWVSEIDTNGWPPAPQGMALQESGGHMVFLSQHCNTCHAIQGSGGNLAPDLTHVGSRQTKEWILEQINNPRSHNASSIMPSFAQLPEDQKQDLADYLAGLK